MLMSIKELTGLGDLGRFSFRRAAQRFNPVNVARKVASLNPLAVQAQLAIRAKRAEVGFLKKRHAAHLKMLKGLKGGGSAPLERAEPDQVIAAPSEVPALDAPASPAEAPIADRPSSVDKAPPMQPQQAAAREKFLKWFTSWKPAEAAALRESNPELFAPLVTSATPTALGDYDALGDMFGEVMGLGQDDSWSSVFSSWADAAGQIVPTVLNDLTAVKTLQLQLQRARSGQPPLSTRTAQQAAVTGQMPMSFSIPLAVGGVVVLALGAVFLAPRLFGRRHHSRFM